MVTRGASLYSFQQAYYLRQMSLEDCIAASARMGATGIETIAEQMMPGFPDLPDSFYATWQGWMDHYGTTPTAHDMFLDVKRWKDRFLTRDEMVAAMTRDIDHAAKLGCQLVRTTSSTPPEIVEECLPHAMARGVKLSFEIHAPRDFDHQVVQQHFEVYRRHGPEWLGFVLDLGIYVRRYPRIVAERFIRDGATEHVIQHIVDAYDASVADRSAPPDFAALHRDVERMGGNQHDLDAVRFASVMMFWSDPRRIADYGPYIHHVHAKFYEITDDGVEPSIPYEEIVPILLEAGFTGCLSSEYEGQRHIQDAFEVDEVEQVGRQHQMLARILGE